jgi:alkylhydroperoxidase family enzyme
MARLHHPDPDTIPDDVRDFLAKFPPDPIFKMLTHSVSTVQPFIQLAQALYTSLELPVRSRELAILTLAEEAQCNFVFTQHAPISEAAGVDQEIRQLIRNRDYADPALSEQDRTIIQFAAEVVAQPQVSDALFASARKYLSEREVVELLQVCGYYWMFSRICNVLEVEVTQTHAEIFGAGWPTDGDGISSS